MKSVRFTIPTELREHLYEVKKCNFCNSVGRVRWTQADGFTAWRCRECGLIYVTPQFDAQGYSQLYETDYFRGQRASLAARRRKHMYGLEAAFFERHIAKGKILDVGCGGGFFLNYFNDRWQKFGIELDAHAVRYAESHFGHTINKGTIETVKHPSGFFDAVVMRGTLEHFPDPRRALIRTHLITRKGGYLYITSTPNAESLCAELYRDLWSQFDPRYHIYYFPKSTLVRVASSIGYRLVDEHDFYGQLTLKDEVTDYQQIIRDAFSVAKKNPKAMRQSPPFWGSMMTLVFQKFR